MARSIVRGTALALVVVSALAVLAAASAHGAPRRPAVALSPLELGVLTDINTLRAQHHLPALHLSVSLSSAAAAHTREMAADGYFEHESANGTAFWKRIASFYSSRHSSFWAVGENILWASPDIDAGGALQSWLDSPPHRANMLSTKWREIGIAAVHADAAPGDYDGQDVTIVTTDFGVRH